MGRTGSLLLLVLSLAGAASCDLLPGHPFSRQPFDAGLWRAYGTGPWDGNRRYEMLDDLIGNHLAVGLGRQAVLDLLGPPDSGRDQDGLWMYNCGVTPSITAIDPEVLGVEFADGRVVRRWHREG